MRDLSIHDFSARIGEDFQVEAGGASHALTLEEVRELPQAVRKAGSFALTFRGPPDPTLPQAIYTFGSNGESLDIFICPISRDGGGTRYEAIFN